MIFAKNDLDIQFLDILKFSNRSIDWVSKNRNYGALSIRKKSDATIIYNGKKIQLSGGCIAYFPPYIDYRRVCTLDDIIVIHLNIRNYKSTEIEYFYPENPEKYYELFDKLYSSHNSPKGDSPLRSTSRVYRIFAELNSAYTTENTTENMYVKQAKEYMQQNFANKDLTVAQVARHLNICTGYLRRLFAQHNNTGAKEYLQNLRINNAARLLLLNKSVREAANMSGFADEKYFSLAFKKQTGISPSKYSEEFY